MENFFQNFSGFTNVAQSHENDYNFNQNLQFPTENSYENMLESIDFKNWVENSEKPLANELDVLRYSQILKEQCNIDENQNLFDADDEAEKIRSGYYLNIHETLNIFKEFHNFEDENPFAKMHEEALEYLKMFQNDQVMPLPSKNVYFDSGNVSGDSNNLEIDTTDDISLLNVSVSDFNNQNEQNILTENEIIVDNVLKQQITVSGCEVIVNNREKSVKKKLEFNLSTVTQKQKKQSLSKNFQEAKKLKSNKMAPKIAKKTIKRKINTSTPKKNEKTFQNIPISPILPSSVDFRSLSKFSSQEFQLLEDKKYLKYLEKQFFDGIFEENGKTIFPIITNCNFKGFMYDLEEELKNNETFITELFFGLKFWRS